MPIRRMIGPGGRARPRPLAGLIDALNARRDEIIEKGLHRIRTEIPEYRAIVDPRSSTTCASTSRSTTT